MELCAHQVNLKDCHPILWRGFKSVNPAQSPPVVVYCVSCISCGFFSLVLKYRAQNCHLLQNQGVYDVINDVV